MSESSSWEFQPGVGWGPFQLATAREDVVSLLKSLDLGYEIDDESSEESSYSSILVFEPYMNLTFESGWTQRLVQISTDSTDLCLKGIPLSGTSLSDVLTALGVESFADTQWRILHAYDDFDFATSSFDTQRDEAKLLEEGTLWLPRLGVGLSMLGGVVDDISIRTADQIPKNGWGPLSEEQYELSTRREERKSQPQTQVLLRSGPLAPVLRPLRPIVYGLIAMAVLSVIGSGVYWQYRWLTASKIEGTLVASIPPEAVFPDKYVYEYTLADGIARTVQVPSQYVGMPQPGHKMQLCYLAEDPDHALTISQANSDSVFNHIEYLFPFILVWIVFRLFDALLG